MHQFWNILLKCRYNFNPNTKKVLTGIRQENFPPRCKLIYNCLTRKPYRRDSPKCQAHFKTIYHTYLFFNIYIYAKQRTCFFWGSIHPLLTHPKPNLLETFGQYIHKVPQKSLPVYFQGVWRGERTIWLQEPWISEALMSSVSTGRMKISGHVLV